MKGVSDDISEPGNGFSGQFCIGMHIVLFSEKVILRKVMLV